MIFRRRSPPLSDADRKLLSAQPPCAHCGGVHLIACPRVRRMVFNASGSITEVEFWPWRDWPKDSVVFPDELVAEDQA